MHALCLHVDSCAQTSDLTNPAADDLRTCCQQALWAEQEEWMSAYRQPPAAGAVAGGKVDAQLAREAGTNPAATEGSSSGKSMPADQEVLPQHFVPTVSDEFPDLAAIADAIAAGDLAAEASARMLELCARTGAAATESAGNSSGGGTNSAAGSTAGGVWAGQAGVADHSSSSNSRDRSTRKSIAAVKLEQDLEIKACEEGQQRWGNRE